MARKFSSELPSPDPNTGTYHCKNVMQVVEASLKPLQTDSIDVYWVHIWDQRMAAAELMRALTIASAKNS